MTKKQRTLVEKIMEAANYINNQTLRGAANNVILSSDSIEKLYTNLKINIIEKFKNQINEKDIKELLKVEIFTNDIFNYEHEEFENIIKNYIRNKKLKQINDE